MEEVQHDEALQAWLDQAAEATPEEVELKEQ